MKKYSFLKLMTLTVLLTVLTHWVNRYVRVSGFDELLLLPVLFSFCVYLLVLFFGFKSQKITLDWQKRILVKEIWIASLMAFGLLNLNLIFPSIFIGKEGFIHFSKSLPDLGFPLFAAIFLFPVLEELFFRKFVCDILCGTKSFYATLFLSAFLFSLAHFFSDTGLLSAFTGGVVLGYIYLKTKKVFLSIIVHILINLLNYPVLYGHGYILERTRLFQDNFLMWYIALLILFCIIIYIGTVLFERHIPTGA